MSKSPQEVVTLSEEDAGQLAWMSQHHATSDRGAIDGQGRISGTREWTTARGEQGNSKPDEA